MAELKPCPFCGGEAEAWVEFVPYETKYERDEQNMYHCGCKDCRIYSSFLWWKEGAIEAWNRRYTPEEIDFDYGADYLDHKITNADRIRAMSDEELADFITDKQKGWCTEIGREMYYQHNMEWLKQPAED